MAGPTCTVLLASELDDADRQKLRSLCQQRGWAWLDDDTTELPDAKIVEYKSFEGEYEYSSAELDVITQFAGWVPSKAIALITTVSQPEFHRELAELAVTLADQFNGVIDLDGIPNTDLTIDEHVDGGQSLIVPYECGSSLIVNVRWLRSWMLNPAFRMVK